MLFATNGKFFTILADHIPKGKGYGEPIRLLIDLDNEHDFVDVFLHKPGSKRIIVSELGKGFVIEEESVIAQTKPENKF